MLNININYPYPVIREYTDDYQSTEFIGELKVLLEPDGYAVHTNFEINNKGIQILLSKRILTYALEVQCVSTWFRKLYTIQDMFPITEKYIEREYTIAGNHLMVTSEHVARTIEQKAKKVLKMLKRGVKFTPTQPDVLSILEKLKTNK